MNSNTKHTNPSSIIPTSVYDLDTIKAECEAFGIEPTRPNIRRIRRAIDLHQAGAVKPFHHPDHQDYFYVRSQTEDKFYIVCPNTGCDCPDAQRMSAKHFEPDAFVWDDSPERDKWQTFTAARNRIADSSSRCKHEIAVMLWQEQQRVQALCDEHDAIEAASDDSLAHSDPVDFRY